MTSISDQHVEPTIFVVDDDSAIRHAMAALLQSVQLRHRLFDSGRSFLDAYDNSMSGCLVLDIRMPGLSGIELQQELADRGSSLPIIFITGFGDIPMAVEAIQRGALDFIEKPFRDQELLDRITAALKSAEKHREERAVESRNRRHASRLTAREREVFELVVKGKPNKIIAHDLDVSQRTVEIHRARVMDKMEANSLADLVRMHLTL